MAFLARLDVLGIPIDQSNLLGPGEIIVVTQGIRVGLAAAYDDVIPPPDPPPVTRVYTFAG